MLAKMVNDATAATANCTMKRVRLFSGRHALCLFALRDIGPNEELRYDYGQPDLPWRTKVCVFVNVK